MQISGCLHRNLFLLVPFLGPFSVCLLCPILPCNFCFISSHFILCYSISLLSLRSLLFLMRDRKEVERNWEEKRGKRP